MRDHKRRMREHAINVAPVIFQKSQFLCRFSAKQRADQRRKQDQGGGHKERKGQMVKAVTDVYEFEEIIGEYVNL